MTRFKTTLGVGVYKKKILYLKEPHNRQKIERKGIKREVMMISNTWVPERELPASLLEINQAESASQPASAAVEGRKEEKHSRKARNKTKQRTVA